MQPRRPYQEKRISDVVLGDKVKITGVVIENFNHELLIDDGSGIIRVVFQESCDGCHGLVQVFGKVFIEGNDKIIRADLVRIVNGLNINLYKKIMNWEG